MTSISVSKTYSGPIPPPELLAQYEQIVPGSAQQIVDQFVKQGNHRMSLEKMVITSDVRRSWAGLILGAVIALVVLVGSFILVYTGKEVIGIVGIVTALGSLVTTFVVGSRNQRREREEKERLRQEMD